MRYINIHTHHPAPDALVQADFGAPRPAGKYSLGIHPWATGVFDKGWLEELRTDEHLAAVGEIGLDYARDVPHEVQRQVFEAQLAIAVERRLSVVLHCVRAFEPVMETLARFSLPAVIFHSFIGSREQVAQAVRRGCFLSMSPYGLASSRTREALAEVPLGQIFVETDDRPVPIGEVYAEVAGLLGISVEELAAATECNFNAIFR